MTDYAKAQCALCRLRAPPHLPGRQLQAGARRHAADGVQVHRSVRSAQSCTVMFYHVQAC